MKVDHIILVYQFRRPNPGEDGYMGKWRCDDGSYVEVVVKDAKPQWFLEYSISPVNPGTKASALARIKGHSNFKAVERILIDSDLSEEEEHGLMDGDEPATGDDPCSGS